MTGTLSAPCERCPERHALCHSTEVTVFMPTGLLSGGTEAVHAG